MVRSDNDDALDPLEREAYAWIRRLTSGEATAADVDALKRWRGRSAAHAEAFVSASRLWGALGPAGEHLREGQSAGNTVRRPPVLTRRHMIGGALAASVAGAMVIRPPFGMWPSWSELRADYRTQVGEQRRITVMDGVSIRMNTRTSIALGTRDGEAGIELVAGEASISVPAPVARPFVVEAGGGRTSTLNANFEIRVLDALTCVTCLRQQVDVRYGQRAVTLRDRQQVSYGNGVLGAVADIDPEVVSAWTNGVLLFRMTPLSDVVAELNRYRSGRIVLLNAQLGSRPVNGRFRIDRPDDVLTQIEQAFGVTRKTLPGGVVLLS
ncbi:FecR domain-containing protein [Bradyrhizobium sp. Ai1a-2]|uniref:FecR family protein n=1 Tax=Bradyrhizobium sp. Ai1a-2 TaxID=196490 RepID=UPI00041043D4|nr:FecR domain-containing protein [Bradyrhizobium sp. Ai1a-2]